MSAKIHMSARCPRSQLCPWIFFRLFPPAFGFKLSSGDSACIFGLSQAWLKFLVKASIFVEVLRTAMRSPAGPSARAFCGSPKFKISRFLQALCSTVRLMTVQLKWQNDSHDVSGRKMSGDLDLRTYNGLVSKHIEFTDVIVQTLGQCCVFTWCVIRCCSGGIWVVISLSHSGARMSSTFQLTFIQFHAHILPT